MKLVRMHLDYLHPWPNQIGFFISRYKGWYREAGWDVDLISDGWERGTAGQKVARGEYHVGLVRLGELLETSPNEKPLLGCAVLNQRALEGLITLKSKGINSFKDLEGRTVGMPTTHPGYDQGSVILDTKLENYPIVPRMLEMFKQAVEADGGDFSKVKIVQTHLWEADIRAVEKGYFDAIASVPGWESEQGIQPAEEVVRMRFDDVGVAPHHSYFISFQKEYAEKNPDFVKKFLEISAIGFKYAYENPDKAITEYGTTMWNVDPAVIRRSLDYMSRSWFDKAGKWGAIDPKLVEGYTKWMMAGDFTTATLEDIPKTITDKHLPEVFIQV